MKKKPGKKGLIFDFTELAPIYCPVCYRLTIMARPKDVRGMKTLTCRYGHTSPFPKDLTPPKELPSMDLYEPILTKGA